MMGTNHNDDGLVADVLGPGRVAQRVQRLAQVGPRRWDARNLDVIENISIKGHSEIN